MKGLPFLFFLMPFAYFSSVNYIYFLKCLLRLEFVIVVRTMIFTIIVHQTDFGNSLSGSFVSCDGIRQRWRTNVADL